MIRRDESMKNDAFNKAFTPEALLEGYKALRGLLNGKKVGTNPLKEIPKSQKSRWKGRCN